MTKHEIMIVANYAEESPVTLEELCEICNISAEIVHELIAYEIVHPRLSSQQEMLFELLDLQRAKTAIRLQHDLEVNLAGVAVVLDLLNELEELRTCMKFLQR